MDILFKKGTELHYGNDIASNRVDDGQVPDMTYVGHGHNLWLMASGRIYAIIPQNNGAAQEHVLMYYSDDAGVSWTTVQVDTTTFYEINQVSSCIDSDANIHIVWMCQTAPGSQLDYVYYRKWTGSSFSANDVLMGFSNSGGTEYTSCACNDADDLMVVKSQAHNPVSILNFGSQKVIHTSAQSGTPLEVAAVENDFHFICQSNTGTQLRHDMWDVGGGGPWASVDLNVIDGNTVDGEYWATLVSEDKLQLAAYRMSPQGLYLFEYTPGGSWDAGTLIVGGLQTNINIGWRAV